MSVDWWAFTSFWSYGFGGFTPGNPMTPHQKMFKVLVLHNNLLGEEELDVLLGQTSEPVDVIAKLVAAEMMTQHVADKFLTLYQHNLKKQGLPPAPIPDAAETHGH